MKFMDEMHNLLPAAEAAVLRSAERLAILRSVAFDMAEPDPDFRELAEIAAEMFEAPVALVTLVDERDQWFKGATGTDEICAPSEASFCVRTISGSADEVFIVTDATKDPRFSHQPRVTGDPHLRFMPAFRWLSTRTRWEQSASLM